MTWWPVIVFSQVGINLGLWLQIRLLTKSTNDRIDMVADHIDKWCVKRDMEKS